MPKTADQVAKDLAADSAANARAQAAILARLEEVEAQIASLKQVVAGALGIQV